MRLNENAKCVLAPVTKLDMSEWVSVYKIGYSFARTLESQLRRAQSTGHNQSTVGLNISDTDFFVVLFSQWDERCHANRFVNASPSIFHRIHIYIWNYREHFEWTVLLKGRKLIAIVSFALPTDQSTEVLTCAQNNHQLACLYIYVCMLYGM